MTALTLMLALSATDPFQPRLLRLELDHGAVTAGQPITATWWWTNLGTAASSAGDERVFVHLRRPGESETAPGAIRGGADHDPGVATWRWRPNRVYRYSSTIVVPANFPPGEYELDGGLFDVTSGARRDLDLPPHPADLRYELARIRVLPPGSPAGEPVVVRFTEQPAGRVEPPPPGLPLTLPWGHGEVEVDSTQPRVLAWRVGPQALTADADADLPTVRLRNTSDGRLYATTGEPFRATWRSERTKLGVAWHGTVRRAEETCLTLTVSLDAQPTGVVLRAGTVQESPGWQLVSLWLGGLLHGGPSSTLALPGQAGRLMAAGGPDNERSLGLDWFTQRLAAVVCDGRVAASLDVPGPDDRLVLASGPRQVAAGAELRFREPAGQGVPWLKLADEARVVLRLQETAAAAVWTDGAALLRAGLPAAPPALYRHTIVYKIFCDSPGAGDFTTFAEALELIRRVATVTDGAAQIVYIVGWQHHGHDTGYPDVFTVNERLGGLAGFKHLVADGAKLNATVSVHDNYDDAYRDSPAWNEAHVARDAAGGLMQGGVWAGGQSYILSWSPTATAAAVQRVERTLALLPVTRSYHIDVLSAVPRRLDWNPAQGVSSAQSIAAKTMVVKTFNRHGIDVTSEGFVAPFVGVLGHAWHLQRGGAVLPGEQRIPLIPFIYHGHATWGGGHWGAAELPEALLYGATFSTDWNKHTGNADLGAAHYLLNVPFQALRDREMTAFEEHEGVRTVHYGANSRVRVGPGEQYDVVVDGRVIGRDGRTFAPSWQTAGVWLAFSRTAGPVSWAAPTGWTDAKRIACRPLVGGAAVPVTLEGGSLSWQAAAGTAYRLTYR